MRKIKVLIVDDSALVRDILSRGLAMDPGIEVVGTAADVYIARDKIVKFRPDVLTLDIEMPRMDGVEFLKRLMPQYPVPVVIVSSLTQKGKQITFEALSAGAVDFVSKPSINLAQGLKGMLFELATKIKIASTANVSHWKSKRTELFQKVKTKEYHETSKALSESTDKVIAIGASTGGTEAIKKVLEKLPSNTPGIVIAQHMPPGFTRVFAERLNEICSMEVKEAENHDRIMTGRVLIAPGDFHMRILRSGGIYKVLCEKGEKVNGHRPSVDVLMLSVAQYAGRNSFGIILTGMGNDGAKGLLEMKRSGSQTIVQDRETSIVYGMPKVAYELGASDNILPLDEIPSKLINLLARD